MRHSLGLVLVGACLSAGSLAAQSAPRAKADSTLTTTVAAMKSALSTLVTAQNTHFSRHHVYAPDLTSTPTPQASLYRMRILDPTAKGWSAIATSAADSTVHCGLYIGSAPAPNAAVVAPGTSACWRVRDDGSMETL